VNDFEQLLIRQVFYPPLPGFQRQLFGGSLAMAAEYLRACPCEALRLLAALCDILDQRLEYKGMPESLAGPGQASSSLTG
jgi:hypothetical protein